MLLFPHFACGFFGLWVLYGISRFILMLQGKTIWSASPKWREEAARKKSKTWYEEVKIKGPLFEEIQGKIKDFQTLTGKKPTQIYLGQKQWDSMKAYIKRVRPPRREDGKNTKVLEITCEGCIVNKTEDPDRLDVA
jgi:hypothetical protein